MTEKRAPRTAEIRRKFEERKTAQAVAEIRKSATDRLTGLDYQKLSKLIEENKGALIGLSGIRPVRLALLGGYTTQPLAHVIRTLLLSEGSYAEIYEAPYHQFKTEILNAESAFYAFHPEQVLLAVGFCNIDRFPEPGADPETVNQMAEDLVSEYAALWSLVKKRTGAVCIQHNFELPGERPLGRLENKYPWSKSNFIKSINEKLWALDGRGGRILDVWDAANRAGLQRWRDPTWYCFGKYGFSREYVFEYGHLFLGLFRALTGKAKKCLVVDLDQTLWGGVVGDDGLNGIQLGSISAEGEAYQTFGRYLKSLRQRGVLLAVNSKNDPATAREVFERHPDMPLRLDDFAAFYCNWESKSGNLRKIAAELNIGLDSLVFIDDNPVECAEVREVLPEVLAVEMKGDPAQFPRLLDDLHLFDQLDITAEDLDRTKSYRMQKEIRRLQESAPTLEDFLKDLRMQAGIQKAVAGDIQRIEQILKKTNQFNLTNRKYESDEIERLLLDGNRMLLCARLEDRLVNYGLVSVFMGRIDDDALIIDNWVMSCRVFARTFEEFIFNDVARRAAEKNCRCIRGEFVATPKNQYVRNLYSRLGFLPGRTGTNPEWRLDLPQKSRLFTFIRRESAA